VKATRKTICARGKNSLTFMRQPLFWKSKWNDGSETRTGSLIQAIEPVKCSSGNLVRLGKNLHTLRSLAVDSEQRSIQRGDELYPRHEFSNQPIIVGQEKIGASLSGAGEVDSIR
jgi:hypothetical protein